MRKVYRLTVYRKLETPTVFGGRVSKTVEGEYDTKEAAETAYSEAKNRDDTVQSRVISVDWR